MPDPHLPDDVVSAPGGAFGSATWWWPRFQETLDRQQRRWRPTAFAYGVVKKFNEDRGGSLAGLIAYYSFVSVFPLLLVFTTILGFVLENDQDLRERLLDTALAQIPAVGDDIALGRLDGSGFGVVLGVLGALWGGLGAMLALRNAMNDVWDVPRVGRPNFLRSRLRSLLVLGVLGLGLVGAAVVNQIGVLVGGFDTLTRIAIYAGNVMLNIAVAAGAFRLLTDRPLGRSEIVPGAILAGVSYAGLQTFAGVVVNRTTGASATYGVFAVVLGLLSWFFLLAQVTVLAAELNAVRSNRLWPRSLSGRQLTDADVRAFDLHVAEARRHPPD